MPAAVHLVRSWVEVWRFYILCPPRLTSVLRYYRYHPQWPQPHLFSTVFFGCNHVLSADPVVTQRRVPCAASGTIGSSRTIPVVRLLMLADGTDVRGMWFKLEAPQSRDQQGCKWLDRVTVYGHTDRVWIFDF